MEKKHGWLSSIIYIPILYFQNEAFYLYPEKLLTDNFILLFLSLWAVFCGMYYNNDANQQNINIYPITQLKHVIIP